MSEPACVCPGPGFCERYQIAQTDYAYRVCSNTCLPEFPCDEYKSQRYRKKWRQNREAVENGTATPKPPPAVAVRPRRPEVPIVTEGPGKELKLILESLGLRPRGGCNCAKLENQMNAWGVADCVANREWILTRLREQQTKIPWYDKIKAATLAVTTGLAFKLNPTDPAPGLLDEALRRAGEKEVVHSTPS